MTMMIIGEAWGRDEDETGQPFRGSSGKFLRRMLAAAGIDINDCYLTNVFNRKPPAGNDVKSFCGTRKEAIPGLAPLVRGKFVRAEYASEIQRLHREIAEVNPHLILALGATPAWALLGTTGIRQLRGTVYAYKSSSGNTIKVLPTYHPSAVLREFTLQPIVYADLEKAKRELVSREISRPKREIWIEPTLIDMEEFERLHLSNPTFLSIDIETFGDQITCIGFAPSPELAIVIPFVAEGYLGNNYWPTLADELAAWDWVKRICAKVTQVVGQNFLYDVKFLWIKYGIAVPGMADDTMLMQHSLQPEMEKGLAFLGSIYTDEASWKFRRKNQTIKQED